jgi:ABC-type tungstate transport system permease subunit
MVTKGTWVLLESIVLHAFERARNLPEDTQKTELRKWIKGNLTCEAAIGSVATVVTTTGREETGVLIEVLPNYEVGFGSYVPELKIVAEQVRSLLQGGKHDEEQ